jgi:hypothetical protein
MKQAAHQMAITAQIALYGARSNLAARRKPNPIATAEHVTWADFAVQPDVRRHISSRSCIAPFPTSRYRANCAKIRRLRRARYSVKQPGCAGRRHKDNMTQNANKIAIVASGAGVVQNTGEICARVRSRRCILYERHHLEPETVRDFAA